MGRKTFESIGHPLLQRHNIILSRQPGQDKRVTWVMSPEDAILAARQEKIFIIGGGSIFFHFMPLVQYMYLTYINAKINGDTYFPCYELNDWEIKFIKFHNADKINNYSYYFKILKKRFKY